MTETCRKIINFSGITTKTVLLIKIGPPIGILLCTDKNHALAEFALAGMDNHLFVSKYLLELPKKEDMQKFIEEQIQNVGYE